MHFFVRWSSLLLLLLAALACACTVTATGHGHGHEHEHEQADASAFSVHTHTRVSMPGEMELQAMFTEFVKQHNRVYPHQEFFHRYHQFKANHARVIKHNAEAAKGVHTYTLGMNRFADLSSAEFRQVMLRQIKSAKQHAHGHGQASKIAIQPTPYQPRHKHDVPAAIDWRSKDAVTSIKDQGNCGSCWAFAAAGAMEGVSALKSGKLEDFSEQQLVDCVEQGTYTCDTGGEFQGAFSYASGPAGIETAQAYPYLGSSGNACKENKEQQQTQFKGYHNVSVCDEAAMRSAVSENPVAVAIDAGGPNFQLYEAGVYQDDQCSNSIDGVNHAVLVVGYGHSEKGGDYWIVKNSWGGGWGLGGYVWMQRGTNQCGIATDVAFPHF